MRKKLTKDFLDALNRAIDDAGSQSELARKSGVGQATISAIINPKKQNKTILASIYEQLYPYVRQYMNAAPPVVQADRATAAAHIEVKPPDGEPAMLKVPVIGFAAAATVNPAIMPIAEFASEYADDYQAFPLAQPGDFCLVVSGDSMLPWYPEGTRLLCRPCRPGRGQRVVAVLGSGEVVFKVFADKGDKFCLFSINDDGGEDFVFSKTDFGAVRAIYSIIESIRDERAIDQAMRSSGIHHRWEDKLKSI